MTKREFGTKITCEDNGDGTTAVTVIVTHGFYRWRRTQNVNGSPKVADLGVDVEEQPGLRDNGISVSVYRRFPDGDGFHNVNQFLSSALLTHPKLAMGVVYERAGVQRMALKVQGRTLSPRVWFAEAKASRFEIGILTVPEWMEWIGPARKVDHLVFSTNKAGERIGLVWDNLGPEKSQP